MAEAPATSTLADCSPSSSRLGVSGVPPPLPPPSPRSEMLSDAASSSVRRPKPQPVGRVGGSRRREHEREARARRVVVPQRLGLSIVDRGEAALGAVCAALRAQPEIGHSATHAVHHVLATAVEHRVLVQVVRVVAADADPRRTAAIRDRAQLRRLGETLSGRLNSSGVLRVVRLSLCREQGISGGRGTPPHPHTRGSSPGPLAPAEQGSDNPRPD
eukprot:scaffold85313_cov67-Phaeocystis_antarctica.AAC.1